MNIQDKVTVDLNEPNNFILGLSLFISFFIFFHIVVFSIFYFKSESSKYLNSQQITNLPHETILLKNSEQNLLNNYNWVDKTTKKVSIPIDVAIDEVISDYN